MSDERRVKLFRNGRNQAIRIPKEFEMPGEEAILRKEGHCLVLRPAKRRSLADALASLQPIDEELPEIDDPPLEPEDIFSRDTCSTRISYRPSFATRVGLSPSGFSRWTNLTSAPA